MYDDTNLQAVVDVISYLNNPSVVNITLAGALLERADWIFKRLVRFKYSKLKKKDKGAILKYLLRVEQERVQTMDL